MKALIWDFDHTLGYRQGGWWGILAEMITQETGVSITQDEIRPLLSAGFPWQAPETPHLELATPTQWWNSLDGLFAGALIHFGVDSERAAILARRVREIYPDPQAFILYDDTLPILQALATQGWTHLMLTNHVPEFGQIAMALGLGRCVQRIFNSAEIGYEKPHPQTYRLVLDSIPGAQAVWMIGDNIQADVHGAEAAGIPAILVRKPWNEVRWYAPSLEDVIPIVNR